MVSYASWRQIWMDTCWLLQGQKEIRCDDIRLNNLPRTGIEPVILSFHSKLLVIRFTTEPTGLYVIGEIHLLWDSSWMRHHCMQRNSLSRFIVIVLICSN